MKLDWSNILVTVIVVLVVLALIGLLTKKRVDANTGEIKTKFIGFEGDKKDNADGDAE